MARVRTPGDGPMVTTGEILASVDCNGDWCWYPVTSLRRIPPAQADPVKEWVPGMKVLVEATIDHIAEATDSDNRGFWLCFKEAGDDLLYFGPGVTLRPLPQGEGVGK